MPKIALGSLLMFAVLMGACSSGTLGRVAQDNSLPQDLDRDLARKFEIQDVAAPAPQPSPSPSAALPPEKPSKKKKKAPKAAPSPAPSATPSAAPSAAPAAPFAYPSRRPAKDPIWIGEKHVFDITYFGMSAGDLTMEALPFKIVNNRKVYHIRATAVSSSVFNLFYRLNDIVESFIDFEGIFSHRFHIVLDETKQSRDAVELYDHEKKQTYYWNRWNHKERGYSETKEFAAITPFAQDSLSALFYLRMVPLPDGGVVNVPVVSEGKEWEAVANVIRREEVSSPMGRVMTVVIKPDTKYQGVLQKKGDSYLWLTDDDRRIVVKLEAKVKVGTVVATLKEWAPGTPP